ncbi:MAG: PIG-L deacetylase family protein [Anaeromyxobacteraceae bacterium]
MMNAEEGHVRGREAASRRGGVLVLAAHPDDETIGAGALLYRLRGGVVVHLTDGAPRDPRFRPEGLEVDAYARARRRELGAALAAAGLTEKSALAMGVPDQDAAYAIADLARSLAAVLGATHPALVVTHPYEGGHPDHDAAAIVARAAILLARRERLAVPRLVEMTSYHASGGALVTGQFLDAPLAKQVARVLSPVELDVKRAMLACFETQRPVLEPFLAHLAVERFRPAPRIDVSRPPHEGPLWYERLGFTLSGARWRALARRAIDALGLTPELAPA